MIDKRQHLILQLMNEGQELRMKTVRPEQDAWIGDLHIAADLVRELEQQKLIRCREVWDKGPLVGKHHRYELTDSGRETASAPPPNGRARQPTTRV